MTDLRMGTGVSKLTDTPAAGRAAAKLAMNGLDGAPPALVLVYASMRYDHAALLAAIREVTGDTPLAGASSSGQFVEGEFVPPDTGVAVLVLSAGPYRFAVGSAPGLGADGFATGQDLARNALAAAGERQHAHGALLVLADGLVGDLQGLLNGVYRVVGSTVPVVGGAAGADRQLGTTHVFHDDRVMADAAVAVWIDSPRPLTVVSGHGWQPNGLPLLVTNVDGPVVHELAGRPALEVYKENFRHEDPLMELDTQRSQGYHSAHAFGLIEPDGSQLIRAAFIDDSGVLRTFAPLPPYSAVQIMSCGQDDLLGITEKVVADSLVDGGAHVLLAFSCVARIDILRERAGEEAALMQKAAAHVPTFGFYTYGEFARSTSVSGYHNATIAALAL
jgi:hypothetical protein